MKKLIWLLLLGVNGFMAPLQATTPIVLITDSKVLAIPIQDNEEPLIDLRSQTEIAYGPSPEIPNNTDYTKIRRTVYEKLKAAQALLPQGLKLCLYEGYRSYALQKKLFDHRFKEIQKANPTLSHEALFIETTKFVSPVVNLDGSPNVPAHNTGGAVDVYLINHQGEAIEMGASLSDLSTDLNGERSKTNSTTISSAAQHYRKIMGKALTAVGFVNYPTEFWHWSYGDRYWAFHTQQPYALYGTPKSHSD